MFCNRHSLSTSYATNFETVLVTARYTNLAKNSSYVVDVQHGVCMCPFYLKHAYCKHLMHAHAATHTRSDKIMLERKFTFRGNTSRARRERGRPRHATTALERM
jgi:hypothetical protein